MIRIALIFFTLSFSSHAATPHLLSTERLFPYATTAWEYLVRRAPDLQIGSDALAALASKYTDLPILLHPKMRFDYQLHEYFYSLQLKVHL